MLGIFGLGLTEMLALAALAVVPLVAAGVVVVVILVTRKREPADED